MKKENFVRIMKGHVIITTGCKQVPLKGHATTTFENVSQKNWKVFWNIFPLLHRWFWCDEKIKEYVTFYAYFSRMQNVLHLKRWEFFQKRAVFFCQRFLSMFFQTWLMITVQHMWFHSFLFHSLMQNEHSQTEILTGYELNAYRRRLFSNFFDSRLNDTSIS